MHQRAFWRRGYYKSLISIVVCPSSLISAKSYPIAFKTKTFFCICLAPSSPLGPKDYDGHSGAVQLGIGCAIGLDSR